MWITVVIICKDEESKIRDCILSAREVADEILVADSGSTDGTLRVARETGGCSIYSREFIDFADFRNWTLTLARYRWVFILDADERITDGLAAEIADVLTDPADGIDGFWVGAHYLFLGHEIRHGDWGSHRNLRLFRRDRCHYLPARVHESLNVDRRRTRVLRHRLMHHSIDSYDEYFRKYVSYTKWSAMDMWDRGERSYGLKLVIAPFFRFFWLYLCRRGFLDGLPGFQLCLLQAFFVTFVKQARLWERENRAGKWSLSDPATEDSVSRELLSSVSQQELVDTTS